MSEYKKTTAIILAGGRGSRMGSDIPKQYMEISGYPVLYYSIKAFSDSFVDEIVLVCGQGDEEYCKREIVEKYDFCKVKCIVTGGHERYNSVANGLRAIEKCDIVFIHDGARPLITCDIIEKSYRETLIHNATVVGVMAKDTIKVADSEGFSIDTPDRSCLWMVQTPQTFDYESIKESYEKLIAQENDLLQKGVKVTDDAMVMEMFGKYRVKLVEGSYRNIKITTPEDMIVAESYLKLS